MAPRARDRSRQRRTPADGLFRREALDLVGALDTPYHYAIDYDLFIEIGRRFPVRRVGAHWAAFRLHAGSKTVARTAEFWREEREISGKHGAPFLSDHLIAHLFQRLRLPQRALPGALHVLALLRGRQLGRLARKVGRRLLRARAWPA